MKNIYEIFVPCQYNNGKPVRTRHHKEWDKVVRKIAGGLSIYSPIKGQWIHKTDLYEERMIPVRIMCTRNEIEKIVDFTMSHYRQLAVLAYKVSEEVIYKEKDV